MHEIYRRTDITTYTDKQKFYLPILLNTYVYKQNHKRIEINCEETQD
jgi:hypothetical protein